MSKPEYVYVASSWANPIHEAVCQVLKAAGIAHYNFKAPEHAQGFHWSEVMPAYSRKRREPGQPENLARTQDYLNALRADRALEGFNNDFDAMKRADTCVLVLPCGRSAHLELGWFVGMGKHTAILLDGEMVVPELMYKMVDRICPSMMDLLDWLGVGD